MKRKYLTLGACSVMVILVIILLSVFMYRTTNKQNAPIVINVLEATTTFSQPSYKTNLTREEFEQMHDAGLFESFSTYESFSASQMSASMSVASQAVTATGVNAELYKISNEYFTVWWGSQRVSPIVPMAISNVETPGRADFNVTWCALFPSKVVPIEQLKTFDVTGVVSNPDYYKVLSSEYSTRDRGALQMSPTYGTGNPTLNLKMSGNEKDKLSVIDTSNYKSWVSGASSYSGDRFYLPDVLLRLTAAFQVQVQYMQKNDYQPSTDLQLVAMLAMSHQSSGVWGNANHSRSIGQWKSGELAYEWSKVITSDTFIKALTQYAMTHDVYYIDTNQAQDLCRECGITNFDKYANKSLVCTYPVKVLYAYIKLSIKYTE